MDPGVMAIKGYSTFPKARGLEPHHQTVTCKRTLIVGVLPLCRDTHSIFHSPSWPSWLLCVCVCVCVCECVSVQSVYSTAPANWAIFIWVCVWVYMGVGHVYAGVYMNICSLCVITLREWMNQSRFRKLWMKEIYF